MNRDERRTSLRIWVADSSEGEERRYNMDRWQVFFVSPGYRGW